VETFPDLKDITIKTSLGFYMRSRLNRTIINVRDALDTYKFNEAANILYKFVWNEFCDWGIEYAKASKDSVVELGAIFKETLKMVSPFMPFISDYLYHKLSGTTLEDGDSLMIMNYPKQIHAQDDFFDVMMYEDLFAIIEEAITAIRRAKVIIDMGNSKIAKAYLKINVNIDNEMAKPFIEKLAKVENIEFVTAKVENSITDVSDNLEVYIPRGEIDMTQIISKLSKQQEKLEKEIAKLSGMLNNERFVANAPANVLEENRAGLASAEDKLAKVVAELKSLG
jgi:valyl-tRNA synthetase